MAITFNCYLDRFEGDMAVLLIDGAEVPVPRSILPPGASEGDYLSFTVSVDERARQSQASEIEELQKRLQSKEDGK